ncbi:MAG: hypothetical protein IT312_01275 [Anaerolineales bacterium]|nr:hypothetical protein [Anaerolineales bacterium]
MKSSSRVFLPLAALILVLACAPAAGAPAIPASDPNAIQLYIQQTAAAASTQTQDAAPPPTITPTFTSTPWSTFTPEATFTPFTFILPSPTPAQRVQYYRAKHDSQLAMYDYRSRTAADEWKLFPQTPEIVVLFAAPKEGTGTHRTTVDGAWERYIDALNDNDQAKLNYLKSPITALFNGSGFPQMESLTMGGNIITLEAVQDGWGRVHTMDYASPGSADAENYFTRPELVHKFVLVIWSRKTKTTYWGNPPKGDIYYPFVSRNDVWVQMERLEPFPILPMAVMAFETQEIYKEPSLESETTGKQFAKGDTSIIIQYYPSGSDVWAQLQSGKWILLFSYTKEGPTYFTNWSMATLPPPPPSK